MKTILALLFVLATFVGIPVSLIYVGTWGIHWNAGSGSQTGYVSATEVEGTFIKTNRAYIKPTLESTQEDVYCVIDPDVYDQLKLAEIQKRSVHVKHYSFFEAGAVYCNGEDAIISSVE